MEKVSIETERLIIRAFDESDFEWFGKLLDMPEYGGWQKQKPRAKEFFNWQLSNYENMDIVTGAICLGVFEKETGDIVGQVAAQEHDDLHEPEFGYGILPFARGKGYAKEAAKATLRWIEKRYDIPYIIGTVEVKLIHMMNERYDFKYYRYYLNRSVAKAQ